MSQTKVVKCLCSHEGQDELRGFGHRVHNQTRNSPPGGSSGGWRCTVCRAEKVEKDKT